MQNTKIQWTNASWNPVRGCTKISPGCAHCYAESFAERFRGTPGHPYEQGFDLRLVPEKVDEPLRWRKPRMIFVNSMSDLFHEDIPDRFIKQVFQTMQAASWHTFQVLTKRSGRMRDLFRSTLGFAAYEPHIWLGVSVEDGKHGLPRVEHLRETPAGLRMLSLEPLLEDLGMLDLSGIGWVIVGGESGPRARTFDASWAHSLISQCAIAGVPCFVKQLGSRPGAYHNRTFVSFRFNERSGADPTEWPEALRVREFPAPMEV
jgi:protein gp37